MSGVVLVGGKGHLVFPPRNEPGDAPQRSGTAFGRLAAKSARAQGGSEMGAVTGIVQREAGGKGSEEEWAPGGQVRTRSQEGPRHITAIGFRSEVFWRRCALRSRGFARRGR